MCVPFLYFIYTAQVATWRGDAEILDVLPGTIKDDVYYIDGNSSQGEVRGFWLLDVCSLHTSVAMIEYCPYTDV